MSKSNQAFSKGEQPKSAAKFLDDTYQEKSYRQQQQQLLLSELFKSFGKPYGLNTNTPITNED